MKSTLLVPTLNEIDGCRAVMPLVDRSWCDQILFLDGGSTDGTAEWCREQGYEVVVQKERGLRKGYVEALEHVRGDVVITFSPDGNSIPALIPPLLSKMAEGYDMVIASRYLPPAKSEDDDVLTAFGNFVFTKSINLLHGGRYTDTMVMYRAYRTAMIRELELDRDTWYATPERLFSTRLSWEPLLSVRAAKRKLKVTEIPGDEPARVGGERKLQMWRWGFGYYFQVVREVFVFR